MALADAISATEIAQRQHLLTPDSVVGYTFLPGDVYASAANAVMRCLCVCPSVCLTVRHVHTFCQNEFFSPSGSHTILDFRYQTAWQYSDGNTPNRGVECRWAGWAEIAMLSQYLASLRAVNGSSPKCNTLSCDGSCKFITLAGKRPSLLMAGNNDEVYNKKPQRCAEDNVTQ